MNNQKEKIQALKDKSLAENSLTKKELDFIVSTLKTENTRQMSYIFETLKKEELLYILDHFTEFSPAVQIRIIPYLAISPDSKIYAFLFQLLKNIQDQNLAEMIIVALASTQYYILPFIFLHLNDEDPNFVKRVKKVMKRLPIKKYAPYLRIMPKIPQEKIFYEVYGKDVMDKLLKR